MKVIKILSICLIAALLSSIFCIAGVSAETIYTEGDYSYTRLDGNNISIYSWEGTGALELPDKLDVYTIKEIRNNCFNSRDDLTTVDLHAASFLTRIGIGAFRNSSVSGELTIPGQVKTVATSAFQNCDSLDTLYYNAMSDVVSSQCFYDCDALREVYLADSLTGIESHAFADCDALSLVRIGENVTNISDTAFADSPNVRILCYKGTKAYYYAKDKGLPYLLINDEIDEDLAGATLSLHGDIAVNFYMELADDIVADPDAKMVFSVLTNGKNQTTEIPVADAEDVVMSGRKRYVFTCNVSASEMTSPITAQIVTGTDSGREYTYTVKEYAQYVLEHQEVAQYAKAASLVKSMLNYGARSQVFFNTNIDKPANADLSVEDQALPEIDAVALEEQYAADCVANEIGFSFLGSSLSLLSDTTLSIYISGTDDLEYSCHHDALGDMSLEVIKQSTYQIVRIRGIKAAFLGDTFTLTVKNPNETESGSVTYSPMYYCAKVLNSPDSTEAHQNAVRALYQYYQDAKVYFNK